MTKNTPLRIFSALLLICLLFTGISCGSNEKAKETEEPQVTASVPETTETTEYITTTEPLHEEPVRAYVLIVEKGSASIETTMPNDGKTVGTRSDIKSQIQSAQMKGKNVLAGVNGDFYYSDGAPCGLCIKDGVELNPANGRSWFGVTKSGKAVIGTASDYYSSYEGTLMTAVGGSDILFKNGSLVRPTTDMNTHPRTAVGIRPDGSTVFVVIDGRQPGFSVGTTSADTAFILGTLGVCDGINLDGGGSSTFILKDESGKFRTKNRPSDGSLRNVANGLMVVLP